MTRDNEAGYLGPFSGNQGETKVSRVMTAPGQTISHSGLIEEKGRLRSFTSLSQGRSDEKRMVYMHKSGDG